MLAKRGCVQQQTGVKRRRRYSAVVVYLPGDVWEHIMHFVDWQILKVLSQCNTRMWSYLNSWNAQAFIPYGATELQTVVLSQCTRVPQVRAVLDRRCQLCCQLLCEDVYIHPQWQLHAHETCLREEVITINHAMKTYDFTFEQLRHLPHHMGMIWKYHGGRSVLPFDVRHTLQGLCLKMHNESLYDRRVRMGHLRQEFRLQSRRQHRRHAELTAVWHTHVQGHKQQTQMIDDRLQRLNQLMIRYPLHPEVKRLLRRHVCVVLKDHQVQWDNLQEVVAQHTAYTWTDQSTVRVARHPNWILQPTLLYAA